MAVLSPIPGSPAVERPLGEGRTAEAPLRVALASDADGQAWDEYVNSQDAATGYHVWGWRTVFERAFGHRALYLVALRSDVVCGVLPLVLIDSFLFGRSLTSLPYLNYGGVLANDDDAANALVKAAGDIAQKHRCSHVELRHSGRRFPALPAKQHKVAMLLDLGARRGDRLDKKVRNQIRKAQKSGLTTDRGGRELLSEFYAVFARNMRDLGTPVYGRGFFEAVLQAFADRAAVHVIRLGSTPVAAAISYRSGGTVEVPWASSVRDYNSLCPNHLLYWSIIEFAASVGSTVLDFGRSTPGEGTFKFKEQWGARPVPLHWEYVLTSGTALPNASPTNPKYATAIALWKRLPLAIATWLGPHIVRSIP